MEESFHHFDVVSVYLWPHAVAYGVVPLLVTVVTLYQEVSPDHVDVAVMLL